MRITKYKNFEIQIEPARPMRVNRDGLSVPCDGFRITIFADTTPIEIITVAVGYELLENDVHEAEQLAKDYVGSEKMAFMKNESDS